MLLRGWCEVARNGRAWLMGGAAVCASVWAAVCGFGGTASARALGDDERGLVDLRRSLDQYPARGHVERAAPYTWLVLDDGSRIALGVNSVGKCETEIWPSGEMVLFSGAPGAVLAFQDETAVLWQLDREHRCAFQTPVFSEDDVEMTALVSVDWTRDRTASAADAKSAREHGADAHVDVAGRPDGVSVHLTATGLELRAGGDPGKGDVLFSETVATSGPACGNTYHAEVATGVGATGVTLLHVSRTAQVVLGQAPDGDPCGDDMWTSEATEERWIELGSGRPRVIGSVSLPPLGDDGHGTRMHVFDVPGGVVRYEATVSQQSGREGNYYQDDWQWLFVPTGGKAVQLASGGGAP